MLVSRSGYCHRAILCCEYIERDGKIVPIAAWRRIGPTEVGITHHSHFGESHYRVDHRHVNELPFTSSLSME